MTISQIRNTTLRRAVIIATVAAIVVCMSAVWLLEAIWERVQRDFGEDIDGAWNGQ